VETSLKKDGGGTGIGLALTRDLVNLMHGTINLDSIPGKGSTFTVVIPLGVNHLTDDEYTIRKSGKKLKESAKLIPQLQEAVLERTSTDTDKETKETLVLIVEDNADILWFLCNELGNEFGLIEAVDGSAGLKLAKEHMPDLIITDLMMPRMDGYELCEKLKSDVLTSHIPIIMLTAKATIGDRLKGLELGADDYISKPFDINEVRIRTRNLIDQRRKLREKFGKEITLEPIDIAITSVDEKFLTQAMDVVDTHMSDASFDISVFSDKMHMSRSTLFRKLEALTSMSPVEFIRSLRLKRAATLLKQQYGNVSEVALEVGFSNPSYFTQVFKKAFSVTPAQFAKS
jgi:DNA-binding response OmpR family regulator